MVGSLYGLLLKQPLLHSDVGGGSWLDAATAVFAEEGNDALPPSVRSLLVRTGVPLVCVPAAVREQLGEAARSAGMVLRCASPALVREWLAQRREWEEELSRVVVLLLLRHCLRDLSSGQMGALCGLPLVPLQSGGWGRFEPADADASPLLLCPLADLPLLYHRPDLVIDSVGDEALASELRRVAGSGATNVRLFDASVLRMLLPLLLPREWHGRRLVRLPPDPGEGGAGGEAWSDDEDRSAAGCDAASSSGPHRAAEPPLGWFLALWELLGRQHSQLKLSELEGWPLLPTECGHAYELPRVCVGGSSMLELGGVQGELSQALQGAGCLSLHPQTSRAHPGLRAYVAAPSACAVLRALRAAAGDDDADTTSLAACFESVGVAGRRALRSMLADHQRSEVKELRSDPTLLPLLRSLPIFEVYAVVSELTAESEASEVPSADHPRCDAPSETAPVPCVALRSAFHRLPPATVEVSLFDERFVHCSSSVEQAMVQLVGIEQLQRSTFFREHIFGRIGELAATQRDSAMLGVLHSLHSLCAEDPQLLDTLRALSFVPARSGVLHCAAELFHPKVSEAAELLDVGEAFPGGAFADEEVLGVLERLGMRSQVTRSAVLQSARSVERLAAHDPEAAVARAKSLLRYVDVHAVRLPDDNSLPSRHSETSLRLTGSDTASTSHSTRQLFEEQLRSIKWLPIIELPPHPALPWPKPDVRCRFASPLDTRPASDLWLVSHLLPLLDGSISCECAAAQSGTSPGGGRVHHLLTPHRLGALHRHAQVPTRRLRLG